MRHIFDNFFIGIYKFYSSFKSEKAPYIATIVVIDVIISMGILNLFCLSGIAFETNIIKQINLFWIVIVMAAIEIIFRKKYPKNRLPHLIEKFEEEKRKSRNWVVVAIASICILLLPFIILSSIEFHRHTPFMN